MEELMIALKEDTVQGFADIYVEKRDGRRVAFDADKIYKALVKASQEVTTMTPLLEAKLEGITNKIVAEVIARFPAGVKIYEIQNIVEHELLNANEYAIAESYITYRTQRENQFREDSCTVLRAKTFDTDLKNSFLNFTLKTIGSKSKTK